MNSANKIDIHSTLYLYIRSREYLLQSKYNYLLSTKNEQSIVFK